MRLRDNVQAFIAWWRTLTPQARQHEYDKIRARQAYWTRHRWRVQRGLKEEQHE